jgi:hypothetical protein
MTLDRLAKKGVVAQARADRLSQYATYLGVIQGLIEPVSAGFFQLVTAFQFWRSSQHGLQLLFLFSRQVFAVFDQQPATAFQERLGSLISLVLNSAAGFADGLIQVFHVVKAINDQACLGQPGLSDEVAGFPHIGTTDFHKSTPS